MKLPPVQNTVLSHVAVKWQISASPYRIFSFVLTVAGNVVTGRTAIALCNARDLLVNWLL